MSKKISALLIAFNEENHIQRYIDEAKKYADEIIIVDSFSTDRTPEIVKNHENVIFIQHPFHNFTEQRNFALSLAKNDWVTFFDADEELSPKLIEEVVSIVNSENPLDAYYVYHNFYLNNIHVRFSGQQTVKAVRLFKKSRCKYLEKLKVHEVLVCETPIGELKNRIKHHSFGNETFYLNKLNGYSKLRAEELYLKKLQPTFYHFYIKPAYRFINYYIIRLGILDGKQGYLISKLHAISIANRYKYLMDIYKEEHLKKHN